MATELFGEELSSQSKQLIYNNVELINKNLSNWIRDQKHIDSDIAQRVLDLLSITKRRRSHQQISLKTTPARRRNIERLVRDGNRMPQFKAVIELKVEQWWNTEMQKHLSPETLFSPSKFQKYLEEAREDYLINSKNKKDRTPEVDNNVGNQYDEIVND